MRKMTESNQEEDELEKETLFQKLMTCCEDAYANGIDSADIYESLHSTSLILSGKKSKESHLQSKTQETILTRIVHSLSYIRKIFFKLIRNLRNGVVILISLVLIAFLLHLSVCTIVLKVSPIKTLAVFLPEFLHLEDKTCLLPSHPIIMEMVRPAMDCSICRIPDGVGGSPIIQFNFKPSKTEFLKVAYSSKPIIVKSVDVQEHPLFNFSHLKEIFESESGGVDSVSDECQFLPFRSPFQTFREALDVISNFSFNETLKQNPWYIGWSNCHPGVAAKLRKLFPRPDFLPENSESSAIDWIFIGSPGLGASMHIDYVRRPSWQLQLSGSKKWILRPPPDCETECPSEVSFIINPGDLLFLETNTWYHKTNIEGSELSISIGSEYD